MNVRNIYPTENFVRLVKRHCFEGEPDEKSAVWQTLRLLLKITRRACQVDTLVNYFLYFYHH